MHDFAIYANPSPQNEAVNSEEIQRILADPAKNFRLFEERADVNEPDGAGNRQTTPVPSR